MDLKEIILIGLKKGLKLIPTNDNKRPIVRGWKNGVDIQEVEQLSKVDGIAIQTGNDLELIDFDLKYDVTGELYEMYKNHVIDYSKELFDKMIIQTTVNQGFHWFYKNKGYTDGNLKLARREATEEEKTKGDKVKVLIETRGNGGYVMIYPTKGYKFIQGDLKTVSYISDADREFLFNLAKSFNSYKDFKKDFEYENVTTKTAFDDYDQKVSDEETIDLLKSHGWKEAGRSADRVSMLRPGETKTAHSGYYELDKHRFSVFSTSTEFESETRYKNSAVYCVLNHNSDWREGAKALYDAGYGEQTKVEKQNAPKIKEEDISKYLENYESIWNLVENWYDGKTEIVYDTGMEVVDNFFSYRKKSLYTITSITNVGKTTIVQYLQILGAARHGLKWLIFAAENSPDDYAEVLLGFYLQDNPKEVRKYNPEKYSKGKKFIEEHFYFLNNCKSLDLALSIAKVFYEKKDIYGLFVDPINSVQPTNEIESWDYPSTVTASRNVVNFRKNYCSVWISQHPTIGKQRENVMPSTTDGEMGAWASKADVSIVLHREKLALDNNITHLKIDKVRSKKLGCKITPEENLIHLHYKQYTFDVSAPKFHSNGTVERVTYRNPLQ